MVSQRAGNRKAGRDAQGGRYPSVERRTISLTPDAHSKATWVKASRRSRSATNEATLSGCPAGQLG